MYEKSDAYQSPVHDFQADEFPKPQSPSEVVDHPEHRVPTSEFESGARTEDAVVGRGMSQGSKMFGGRENFMQHLRNQRS